MALCMALKFPVPHAPCCVFESFEISCRLARQDQEVNRHRSLWEAKSSGWEVQEWLRWGLVTQRKHKTVRSVAWTCEHQMWLTLGLIMALCLFASLCMGTVSLDANLSWTLCPWSAPAGRTPPLDHLRKASGADGNRASAEQEGNGW